MADDNLLFLSKQLQNASFAAGNGKKPTGSLHSTVVQAHNDLHDLAEDGYARLHDEDMMADRGCSRDALKSEFHRKQAAAHEYLALVHTRAGMKKEAAWHKKQARWHADNIKNPTSSQTRRLD